MLWVPSWYVDKLILHQMDFIMCSSTPLRSCYRLFVWSMTIQFACLRWAPLSNSTPSFSRIPKRVRLATNIFFVAVLMSVFTGWVWLWGISLIDYMGYRLPQSNIMAHHGIVLLVLKCFSFRHHRTLVELGRKIQRHIQHYRCHRGRTGKTRDWNPARRLPRHRFIESRLTPSKVAPVGGKKKFLHLDPSAGNCIQPLLDVMLRSSIQDSFCHQQRMGFVLYIIIVAVMLLVRASLQLTTSQKKASRTDFSILTIDHIKRSIYRSSALHTPGFVEVTQIFQVKIIFGRFLHSFKNHRTISTKTSCWNWWLSLYWALWLIYSSCPCWSRW